MNKLIGKIKWLPPVLGAGLALFGVAVLFWPQYIIDTVTLFSGLICFLIGFYELITAFFSEEPIPEYIPGIHKLRSIVNVSMGIVLMFNRTVSVVFIAVALGIWGITFGLLRLHDAVSRHAEGKPWRLYLADCIIKCSVGVLLLASPLINTYVWVVAVASFFILIGISIILSAIWMDRGFLMWKDTRKEDKP